MKSTVRVGTGAGFSDDRFEPARDLAERGAVDYLVFECLAERTIARETLSRLKNPELGYTPYLVERFEAVLPACRKNNVRVITKTWGRDVPSRTKCACASPRAAPIARPPRRSVSRCARCT